MRCMFSQSSSWRQKDSNIPPVYFLHIPKICQQLQEWQKTTFQILSRFKLQHSMFIAYVYFYLENTITIFIELRNANTKTSKEQKIRPSKRKARTHSNQTWWNSTLSISGTYLISSKWGTFFCPPHPHSHLAKAHSSKHSDHTQQKLIGK